MAVAAAILALPMAAGAQQNLDYEYDINKVGKAVALEQPNPGYPGNRVRRGQEGWVRMSFVVTAEGRAIDPIILDSSGGVGFEQEAKKVIADWRFEPMASESPWNFVDVRSEIERGRDRATSNFGRRYSRIMNHLYDERNDTAREQVDQTNDLGGWNLYESTMLWLMIGRVEGAEDNQAGKLEAYSRALSMGNANAIPVEDRVTLLEKVFLLQSHFGQLAAADRTHRRIQRLEGNEEALERTAERAAEIRQKLAGDDTLTAKATIFNPCNCDEGTPLWDYRPARRTFSFANTFGNVERFEVRCEAGRIKDEVEAGKTWTLAPDWGACRVLVFGDDGATFDFLEHRAGNDDAAAVARSHVLDRRDRGQ